MRHTAFYYWLLDTMTTLIHIGKHKIVSKIWVAPMSGVTDLPFRRLLHQLGAGLVVSEMIASEELAKGNVETLRRAAGGGVVDPLVIQLAGRETHWMAQGAKRAVAAGADIVDINMGCPARKVTKGLSGSALMKTPDHALDLIKATVDAVDVPVTLKMRLGWDDNLLNAPEIASRAEEAGVQLITVHGRTRCQFYKGEADWAAVKDTVEAVSVPVIVNGDIRVASDVTQSMEQSGANGAMVGRGLVGRPWAIFDMQRAAGETVSGGGYDLSQQLEIILTHLSESLSLYGDNKGVRMYRKHLAAYIEHGDLGLTPPKMASTRSRLCQINDARELSDEIRTLYTQANERAVA